MVITSIGEARWHPRQRQKTQASSVCSGWHKFEAAGSLREPGWQSSQTRGVKSRSLGSSRCKAAGPAGGAPWRWCAEPSCRVEARTIAAKRLAEVIPLLQRMLQVVLTRLQARF